MVYWFNTRTRQVESDEDRSRDDEVMGPYATRDEAEHAFEIARRKTEEWDAREQAWDEDGLRSPGDTQD